MAFKAALQYKKRPLLRCKNEMYYGKMTDPYVVYMQILSTKEENGQETPDKVALMLLSTDSSLALKDRLSKQTVKNGLYNALDFANVMLGRALVEEGIEE